MATNKKNKVKFGLQNVYWAKINEWGEDPDGTRPFLHMVRQSTSPVLYRCLSMQTARQKIFMQTTAFTTSSTTMQDIQVTLKLLLLQPNLQLRS